MNVQFTLALRYLGGRKLRTVLTTLAIVFGVMVIFGLNLVLPAFVASLQSNLMTASGHVDAVITLKTSDAFPAEIAAEVASVDGVRQVSGSFSRPINVPADYYDKDPNTADSVGGFTLTGINPETASAMHIYMVQDGRFLEAGDMNAVVITDSLADALHLEVGDTLKVPSVKGETGLTVVGLLPARMQPGNEELLVTLPQAQAMLEQAGRINTVEANFDTVNAGERAAIEAAILAKIGDAYQVGALEVNSEFMTNLQVAQIMLNLLGLLALLMGGFIIFNTFRTVVAERRRDIGMLRALGATRRTVMQVILAEALLQGIVGTVVGLLLGYVCGRFLLSVVDPIIGEFFNTSIETVIISPWLLLVSIGIGLGVTLLAGLLPARSASTVTPMEALRPSVGVVSLKQMAGLSFWGGVLMIVVAAVALFTGNTALLGLGGALFIVGLILTAPALVNPLANGISRLLAPLYHRSGVAHLAQGNIARQPDRTAVTASTTLIGMAILIMAGAMVSSMTIGLERVMHKNLGSDFILLPPSISLWGTNVGADSSMAQQLSEIDGVAVVSSLRFAPSSINDLSISVMGIEPDTYKQVSGLNLVEGNEDEAYTALSAGRNMIVNGILASTAGIEVGDEVQLMTPNGAEPYRVIAVGGDIFNIKIATAYISQANIAADFGRNEDVEVQLNLTDNANADVVEDQIKAVIAAYPQFRLINGTFYVNEILSLLDAAFAGMSALVIFLTIPSLIAMVNTLAISVIERTREIGMLRAVGATRRQIRSMITIESLILAGLGTLFGILSGLYMGYMAVNALKGLGFPMEFAFPLTGVLLAFAGSVLLGFVAAIIPARQASHLEIVEALRYE